MATGHVLNLRDEAIAVAGGQQVTRIKRAGHVVGSGSAGLQFDEGGNGLAITATARQGRHRQRVSAPIATQHDQGVNGPAFESTAQGVTCLERERIGCMPMTRARAYPTLIRHHDGHRLVNDFNLCDRPLLSLDKGSTLVTKRFGIRLDFLHHQPLEAVGVVEDVFEFRLILAQLTQLLFNLNGLQPGQLAQADFEDVLGLTLGQLEARDEGLFGFLALADDGDHLVNVQQYQLATFQDMNPVKHFAQTVLTALDDGVLAEANPFRQHAAQRLRHRLTINPDHGQVDAAGGLQAGVRQQLGDQLGL